MFLRERVFGATLLGLTTIIYPQISEAEGFSGEGLLKWDEANQNSYFWSSVTMAGVIASQNRREAARCIDEWYSGNDRRREERNQLIRKTMQKYPSHNPQAVIFAIIRKQCGRLFE
tara:strand:+ start:11622 stop:11969 length:348 start_codon:yes stop_codon:yes gene_type:complete